MGVSISEFRGEYYFLSNFYSAPVTYNGMCFENNEAAFQAAKCPERMTEFCRLNPSEAKRLGRRVKLRGDWEAVKDTVMYEICKAKFSQKADFMAEKVRIPNNNDGEIDHKQLGELTQFLASIPMNYWSAPQIAEILMRNGWIKDD